MALLVRSAYSFLRGVVMPQRWVDVAANRGCEALILADWAGFYGALPFLEAAEAQGAARPVLGAELPVGGRARLVGLCEDLCGYRNLAHILSRCHGGVAGEPAAPDPVPALRERAGGLILLTNDRRILRRLREALEATELAAWLTSAGPPAERLVREADRLGVRCVALSEAVVEDAAGRETLRLLEAIRRRELAPRGAGGLRRPRPPSGIEPSRFAAARALTERCSLRLADLTPRTFVFPRVGGAAGRDELRRRCREALGGGSREARRRLERELAVIEQLGFVDYFLATARITSWARQEGIPTTGRGSGVASLVAYLLGITNVDPMDYGLCFERFLHPLRGNDPDLDIDVAWDRRDEVIAHALGLFGVNRAARISTHQFFRERGAFREAGRALGLGDEALSRARGDLDRLERDPDPSIRRGLGIHPGGIVLSEGPISHIVPLERSANGDIITQFEMHGVEKVGLIKIDFLGNRALSTVAETTATLRASGTRVDLGAVAHDDRATIHLLAGGRTLGCFQLESPAMRGLLQQLEPRDLAGVVASIALVRPGPASSGMKQAYIRRAHGREPPDPVHPQLREVLRETLGLPLYEEDVMRMAAALTGVGYAEADMLRRAIGQAAARDEDLRELRRGFLTAARARGRGEAAEVAWDEMARFAAYAFCKAHAAGFGELAYRCAYLKAHHPGPFFAAVLNHHQGMYPRRVMVDEARRLGIALAGPCIHRSRRGWRWEPYSGQGRIRCGLARVRNLREETLDRLLEERGCRPFADLADFARRVRPAADEFESLLLAGAFDGAFRHGPARGALVFELQRLLRARRGERRGQPGLGLPPVAPSPDGGWRDISPQHRARLERRLLGISLTLHPVRLLPADPTAPSVPIETARERRGRRVRCRGIVSAHRLFTDRAGRRLHFLSLEDESGLLECVTRRPSVTPPALDDYVQAEGVIRGRGGARGMEIDRVVRLGKH